jgi:chromosomal replication initiator protein
MRSLKLPSECPREYLPIEDRDTSARIVKIEEQVAFSYDLGDRADFLKPGKQRDVVWPRQVAMYFIRELTTLSWHSIGRRYGKNHGTAMWAHRRVSEAIECYPELRAALNKLRIHMTTDQLPLALEA